MKQTEIEVFLDDADGEDGIGFLLRDPSIVEHPESGDLVAGGKLTEDQAQQLKDALDLHIEMLRDARL